MGNLYKTIYKLIIFIKTPQRLKQEWQKSPAGTRQTDGKILVWFGNRKKISQIIKDYFYLPFFLLIILCPYVQETSPLFFLRIFKSIMPLKCNQGYYCDPEGGVFACMDWTFGSRKMMVRLRGQCHEQCCGSMTFWCGSGFGSADPCSD